MNATLTISSSARAELAPTGKLRAGINYGNVILAAKDTSGELRGVHIDLARELGRRLSVPVELLGRAAAGTLVEELKAGALDVALLSSEPSRAGEIVFSPAYLEVDATYLVPPGSPLHTADDVDRDGIRIAIAAMSVYEFYLLKHLKHAKLLNAPSTHAAYELFAANKLDALVGLRPRLVADSETMPGSRIVDGRFMVVEQAVASPRGRDVGAGCIRAFIEDVIASEFVARSLEQNGVRGVTVAPRPAGI